MIKIGSFIKSSLSTGSNGGCLEAGTFARSSFCSTDGCLEAGTFVKSSLSQGTSNSLEAQLRDGNGEQVVAVRDSKDTSLRPVFYTLPEWQRFLESVRAGMFPVQDWQEEYPVGHLTFTKFEWECFIGGVEKGDFDLPPELASV